MRFVETAPGDFPDPRLELVERMKHMPIPVMGFVPQPSLEDADLIGVTSTQESGETHDMSVSIGYTLWRNPDDHSDPVNLADLDEKTRKELDEVPPWPLPQWLVEYRERMRYPQLWEAVRTTWYREQSEQTTLRALLVNHVNHILTHQYRQEYWPGTNPWEELPPAVTQRAVNEQVSTVIDGVEVPGAEIDTDPFVYGIGAQLDNGGILTAMIPRAELDFIQIQFTTRQ